MPNRLLISTCCLILLGVAPVMAQTGEPQKTSEMVNLVDNGSFEQGLEGWKLAGKGTANPISPGRSGSAHALETSEWAWVQQDLSITKLDAGGSYMLSAWAGSEGSEPCILGFAAGDSRASGPLLEQRLMFGGGWNTKMAFFTLPPSAQWAAIFVAGTGAACQFTDIRLSRQLPAAAPNPLIVSNGGFEQGLTGWNVVGGELLRGVGLEGKQSLVARGNSVLQQLLPANLFNVGMLYELQASVSKGSAKGQCEVGLKGTSTSGLSLSQQVVFEEATPLRSWLQKSAMFSIPEDTAWITLQVETRSATCSFDGIRIVQQATAGTNK